MRYKILINIRHVGDIVDGRFSSHLSEMQTFLAYFDKWKDLPVTLPTGDAPMDWDDPVKVWYKLMGNMPQQTSLRAVPQDPPPPGLPPDAPGLRR